MKTSVSYALFALCVSWANWCTAQSSAAPPPLPASTVQPVLDAAANEERFTFVVFHKGDSVALRRMRQVVNEFATSRGDETSQIVVDAKSAGEQALIEKLGIGRAPMPLTVAIAPNGAVTGVFPKAVNQEQLSTSIVPPTMMRCMKSLQDRKLVFICMTTDPNQEATVPPGVQALQLDPVFKDRVDLLSMLASDPAESRFVDQLKVKPANVKGPYAVLVAPPGVLVGHFDSQATVSEIGAAIHKAGECCDDPNCKHNQASTKAPPAPKTPAQRN